jgi:hypothetical protein
MSKCVLSLAALLFGTLVSAQTPTKIGSLDLSIGGLQATVTPSQPVIPKNIASGVQVVVSQNGQTLAPATIAQYLGGAFQIVGELSGPGLTQTIDVPQSPPSANSLIINLPAMTTGGDYTLSNLRFLVNGQSVLDVSPSTVTVKVIEQVLVTSVQTQPLTLDQIQAMGVVLGSSDYTGFQFTVGLQLSSQVVNISFPVVFDGQGVPVPQPISPPALPPLGANVNIPLPTIIPILLQSADGSAAPTVQLPDGSTAPVRIPSVLVIPGNVGYLKQFFSAQLYVSNGAPGGSNLSVRDVTGTINLPPGNDGVIGTSDDPLSLPDLASGPETATLAILAPGPDGKPTVNSFNPGQTGQAQWTIRGDKEGFQTINFDIAATLDGLPTGSVALKGTASGGVLVRNPYFNMTFTVPGVVRKGELFNVFATVTNTSQVAANNLTVDFDNSSISGVMLASGQSPVISTLNPGDSTTLTYQFQSLRTGQVVASYLNFDTQNGTTGNLNFALGVFANGTPMSPDTLVLPSSVDNLPTDVVDAAMRVLGQAWSVATASNTLPAGVISTSRTVVTQKALALAESGLRQSLGETLPNALRDLATDFWGGSTVDPGFDQVLRTTPAGQNFARVLGAHLAQPATQAGGASPYELQVAQVLASGPNFITVGVGSGTGPAPVSVTLTDGAGNQISSTTPGGTILGGVLLPLGSSTNSPVLGLLTSPTNSPYTLILTGQSNGAADLSISIPRGDGTVVRGTAASVTVVQGQQMRAVADLSNPNNLVLQVDSNGDGSFATSIPLTTQAISPSGPSLISATVIGPETVSQAGKFGLNLVALFDRIVDSASSAGAPNYSIPNNTITSASRQLSGRLVFANLAQPEGPYVPQTFAASGIADQRGITGPTTSVNMQSRLQDPGAVVTGRVLGADGNASPTATVNYSNTVSPPDCSDSAVAGFANVPVRSDGIYQYRYVHQDQCGGPFQMSTKDPQTGAVRSVSAYVRAPGQQMVIDLALLGLGSVAGRVLDLSGNPVPSAQVVAVSGTDPQIGGRAFTDGIGNYSICGITVGPVTVTAVKGISLGTSAGNIERAGTTAVVNVTMNGGAVQVSGTVTQLQNGTSTPVPGLPVVYYVVATAGAKTPVGVATTAADGSFSLSGMPTGPYDLVAAPNSVFQVDHADVAVAGDRLFIPLEIVLPTTGTVNGKVTLPGGVPAAGVVVFQNQNGVLSNADGTFSLSGIPVRPSQSQTIFARTVDGVRSGQTSIVLNSGTAPVNGANITLSGLGSAQFTVLDATGHLVSGQKVVLIDGFTASGCGSVNQTTDVNGRVTFTGLPIGTVSAAAILSRGTFTDLALGSATIAQDGTTGFATMQFNGSGTVTGNVVDANKNPALGAVVQLTSKMFDSSTCSLTSAMTQSVQTDVSGNFRFTGVNVGQVGVTASNSFFPTQVGAQGNLASNGATVNFSLHLVNSVSGVLSGTVYLPDGTTAAGSGIQVTANGPLPDVTVNTDGNGFFKFAKIFPEGLYTLTANDPVSGGVMQMKVYLRAGQDTKQDLRLKGTGTINVSVVDGAGAAVSSAFVTLTETDYPNESFDGSLDASNQGLIAFPNIFEGGFSVQVKDSFARGGRTSGTLPQGAPSLNVQVQLTTTGTIQGHFYLPDGATAVPNGIVQLTAAGRVIGQATTLGTGDVGSYSFEYVPAGPVELKAQDPLTGRTGIAAGSIDTQGQVLSLNVKAQGLDTVQGLVTSNGSAQPGASVTIASNNFQATTLADANGMYLMNGVPEGVVTATASLGGGFLSGTATSPVNGDGTTLTLNVTLRSSGTVTGKVVQADGVTPSPSTSVSISVGGTGGATEATITDAQGSFSFARVPAGSGTISAQVLGGFDQGVASVSVPAGSSTNVQVTLNGVGALSGHALDSTGNPTAGTIVLTGTGTFPYSYNLTAASDGTFSLPQVLAGPFTAKLSANIGGVALYGTATGSVVPNQTANVSVQLQPSGTIRGLVVRPDGETPAVGANVSIQLTAGGLITLQAQNDGTFAAIGVPLGTFTVRINDPLTSGLGIVLGQSVGANGQTVDLGTITLDSNALTVVASNPTEGATGIGVSQPLTVTFSEALSGTGGIYVTNGASNLSLGASLSGDGKTVTLQGQMPDGVLLTLNVTAQVTDVFGRQLLQPQTIHFTTADLTPPVVVAVAPANQAIQVPVNSTVAVTFNKALSTTALPANGITLGNGAVNVPGTSTLTAPNVLTFTPLASLSNNAIYTVTVSGAVSFGGNVQTTPFSSMFVSPETTAPVLQLNSPASGAFVGNARPTISISLGDSLTGINVASATLVLDGQLVAPAVGTNLMSFTPVTAMAEGTHTFTASVQNNAGILGTLSASFVVDTAPPSVAALTGITVGQVLKGQVSISASATDSVSGINHIKLLVDGTVQASIAGPSFSVTLDTTHIADGPHNFTVQAVNNAGTIGPASAAVQAFVENVALSVSITSPAVGAPFKTQVAVTAVPSEPVQKITFSLGTQTVTATASPYQGTLSLSGVADGPQIISVTAYDFAGDTATSTVAIAVMQTPPVAPNANLIFAEPPNNGVSLVHGLSGAVSKSGLLVTATDTVNHATSTGTSANDGSFAESLTAAVNDTVSLTATDVVGNVSAATLIAVRQTPSLPPASGSTTLTYQGELVDRVGLTSGSLSADGVADGVFTLGISIGDNVTRTISYVDLQGPTSLRSTRSGNIPLGVASDVGSPLLNSPNGPISFPITTGATLTLFAGDGGFIQAGGTYTASAVFTDGSKFVGTFTIVAPADQQYVAHSATITANPATALVNGTTPGTSTITITNIRDINGTEVPDGAKIALSAANMASVNPAGTPIPSAGGSFTDGTAGANNTNFAVYTISNGSVTATYTTQPVTPAPITGALAVIQMQATDANNNVLGTRVVSSQDLNIRSSSDTATISVSPGSLYADRGDHRSHVTVILRNASGSVLPDGTRAAISVAPGASIVGCCGQPSAGGTLLNGAPSPNGTNYVLGTMSGGRIDLDYSDSGLFVGRNQSQAAIVQVLAVNGSGVITSSNALEIATLTLVGAAGADINPAQPSVPQVSPTEPLQIKIQDVHDTRGNLVPDGANIGISATAGATVFGCCGVSSAGGTISDGTPSSNRTSIHYFPLISNGFSATYLTDGSTVTSPGQTSTAVLQLAMVDPNGNADTSAISVENLILVPPSNVVGSSQPASLLGDGVAHIATVIFKPVLDAFGNQIPDGTTLAVTANPGAVIWGCCGLPSAGGQILSGTSSPSNGFKVHTVQGGALTVTYADQNVTVTPGQQATANVAVAEVNSSGQVSNSAAVGVAPVLIAGLTSAQGSANPAVVFANGGDYRSTITLTNFRDAAGNPAPDGTQVAVTAVSGATISGCCGVPSAGGVIEGGQTTFDSRFRAFTVTNGQIVFEYSSQGVSVASGTQTAMVQVVAITPSGIEISSSDLTTVAVQLLAPGSASVSASPADLTANGNLNQTSITITGLKASDGVTPVPDGALVGIGAGSGIAIFGCCSVSSAGGVISSAGTSPGDGTATSNNANFSKFTVAGGQVVATYSDAGVLAGVGETKQASIPVVPVSSSGSVLTTTAIALGTVRLHGVTSATSNGPSTMSIAANSSASITFSGIKDSAGNTVPDGTAVVVTAANGASVNGCCTVPSSGGTIVDGNSSASGANFKVFTTVNGAVTATYSTSGASVGTARVQILPAKPDGTINGSASLVGGLWAINVTN